VDEWFWNHYDLTIDMAFLKHPRMKLSWMFVIVLAFSSILESCRRPTDNGFVVVRVCRDAHSDFSRELDRRLYGLNNRRVSSGKLIVVATMEGDYQEELAKKIALVRPQVIIFDSPGDVKQVGGVHVDLQDAKSACGANRDCPAFIPPWVSGEEQEATQIVFSAITAE
jgi:hypothetical protein